MSYPPPAGVPRLRDVLAGYLRRKRGALLPPGQLVVTAGSTQAVSAVARVLLQAGHRRLAVEDPTDVRERQILQAVGLEVVPVPVDRDGLDIERLARSGTRAVLLAPTHHFPTGAVLSARRRVQLAD
ncbi:aminotransferase class I/II-fold pyridoxal phosphate-dependent enzyme [Streptomyces sp. NPDC058665]|uniref:aminotransferase class I/II-fold pyridoxal phosphate-dependent enzyme n=1 Tax=Streptomyces sp. NPDC058665 TaxID=3346586 RepID=UPI003668799A